MRGTGPRGVPSWWGSWEPGRVRWERRSQGVSARSSSTWTTGSRPIRANGYRSIFSTEGEQAFRERERKAIRDAVSVPDRVIATGGGAFLDAENRRRLKAYAPVIFLDVSPAGALTRLAGDTSRPLLSGEDREKAVAELMARRRPAYSEADFRVDTENLTPDRVAGKVLHLLARGTKGGPSGERAGKERRGR